jgi:predicted phosphate transport protein (TIGR00153 family)
MRTITNLFSKSPFASLTQHMDKVLSAVLTIKKLFTELKNKNYQEVTKYGEAISEIENEADSIKNELRNSLSGKVFLPVDKSTILEVLAIQDGIADKCEDIGVLLTYKKIEIIPEMEEDFFLFLDKNIETVKKTFVLIEKVEELFKSSFSSKDTEIIKELVDEIAYMEHEADVYQKKLLQNIFANEEKMTFGTFYIWTSALKTLSDLSNYSEKLANRIRMILD